MNDFSLALAWKLIRDGILGGIGSGASGFAIGRVLSAIFGSGNDSGALLEKISREIEEIAATVELIETQVSELITELQLDVTKIEGYVEQAAIAGDIAAIEQHYTDLQEMAQAAADQQPLPFTREQFAAEVLGAWDIPVHVYAVLQALLGNGGLDAGLLNTWTDYLIESTPLPAKPGAFLQAYTLLQGWFQDQLQHVVKGVAVVTSAKCDGAPASASCAPGAAYLQEVAPHMAAVVERFVSCVERLALRPLDMTALAKDPTLPADALTILERADFLAALLNSQPAGLRGRLLVQPHQADAARGGPVLQPDAAYPASTGTTVAIGSAYLESLPRCVEITFPQTPPFGSRLTPYARSAVQIVRYEWAWPSPPPPAGQPLASGPGFRAAAYANPITATPRYVDPKTGLPVQDQQHPPAGSVLYGHFVDASALFQDLVSLAKLDYVPPGPQGSHWDRFADLAGNYDLVGQAVSLIVHLRAPGLNQWPGFDTVTYGLKLSASFQNDADAANGPALFFYVGYDLTTEGQTGQGANEVQAHWATAQFSLAVDGATLAQEANGGSRKFTPGLTASGTAELSRAGTTAVTLSLAVLLDPSSGSSFVVFPENGVSGLVVARLAFIQAAWQAG